MVDVIIFFIRFISKVFDFLLSSTLLLKRSVTRWRNKDLVFRSSRTQMQTHLSLFIISDITRNEENTLTTPSPPSTRLLNACSYVYTILKPTSEYNNNRRRLLLGSFTQHRTAITNDFHKFIITLEITF